MTDKEKFQKNPEQDIKNETKSTVTNTKAYEIVQAFKDAQNKANPSYFSGTNRNTIVADFRTFVAENYGDGMLHTLQKEGKLDQAFNEIADRGFTIKDFFDHNKKETIRQQLGSVTNESQALSQSCMDCYTNWLKLTEDAKKKIPFEEFIRDAGFDITVDDNGTISSIALKKNSKIQSISQLSSSRKEYVRMKTDNSELIKIRDNCMDTSAFDPTEKISCITTVRTLYDRIQKLDGSKRTATNELLEDVFGKNINKKTSIGALTPWTNFVGLERQLEIFFQQLASLGLSEHEINQLKELSIDTKQCLQYGEYYKELESGTYDKTLHAKKFSEFDKKVQKICDGLVTTNLINTVDTAIDDVEKDIASVGDVFNIPGSMKSFFGTFSKPDLSQLQPNEKERYFYLIHNRESLIEQIQSATGEDERKKLLEKLEGEKKELSDLKMKSVGGSTNQYFQHIGQQVTDACTLLGKEHDLLGKQIISVLQKLHDGGWDMSTISDAEHNIIMRSSVIQQLAGMKEKGTLSSMGYDFDQYAAFVSELYDFTSKKSVLKTRDGHTIDLNFTKKRYVGKPYDGQVPEIADGFERGLENLHVEFELDINNNPDAIDFLTMITGGQHSQLFQKITDQTGKEQLITESSYVEMVGPDGQTYKGYLSPALLDDISVGDDDDSKGYTEKEKDAMNNSSNTFVLYSQPVDQRHEDRTIVTKPLQEGSTKGEPIYINPDNAKDWKINILDHRVTLNDAKINTLGLGHVMAQEYDKQQLLAKEITESQDDTIAQKLNTLKDVNFHDKDTNQTSSSAQEVQTESLSDDIKYWNELFSDGNKDKKKPQVGMRFALQVDSIIKPMIGGSPDDPKLLSATIKHIAQDGSITFGFDTLTRSGECSLKDLTLKGSELAVLNNKEAFKKITYLGTAEDNKRSYPELISHLSSTFDDKKRYNFGLFSGLDLKDGKFMKGNEPVSFIIPIEQTKKDYYVEYTVEKVGENYHVKSTGFDAEVPDKDAKKQIQTSFDITTDLSGVLLLLAGKNIAPYTKKEKDILKTQERGDTLPQKDKKIWSLSTLFAVLKSGKKSVIDGIKKKRGEKKEEELKYLLFTEGRLYRKMSDGPLGKLLGKFDLNAFNDLADEAESGGMDYHRKKIEGFWTHFKKFNLVYNAPNAIFGMNMIYDVVKGGLKSYPNLSLKQRHKIAAVLLQMLDKMKSGYAKNFAEFPRGTYVKLLMGPVAYTSFLEKYRTLEQEAKRGTDDNSKKKLENLAMLEYNFIVENTRGGANMDPDRVRAQGKYTKENGEQDYKYAFYFQNIYGREYANQLGTLVGNVKNISADKNSEDVKKHISSNNFDFIYNECKTHIGDMRGADAVSELVALQHLASNKEQADQVFVLMMSGILNGLFVHHIGKDTKEQLKGAFRNGSIPFPHRIEHHDVQQKIQTILTLATGNLSTPFDKFTYTGADGTKSYVSSDFDPIIAKKADVKGMADGFMSWIEGPGVKDQIISFLHMDGNSLKTENNLIKIRKTPIDKLGDLKIFGKSVSPSAKNCVDDIMGELYTNRSRGASLDNYNAYSGLTHTSTTIENFYRDSINSKYHGQDWDPAVGDHAAEIWSNLKENAPSGKEKPTSKDILSHHVNEFFRVFQRIGSVDYESSQIDTFYKHIRLAKQYNEPDRSRLIWFEMTKLVFSKGPVPEVVSDTFVKYMKYFEENIDNFDAELGSLHPAPGDHSKNFSHSFIDDITNIAYVPYKEWKHLDQSQQTKLYRDYEHDEIDLLNMSMSQANKTARGNSRGYGNTNKIGISYDEKIRELRGGSVIGLGSEISPQSKIRITNKDSVDRSKLPKNIGDTKGSDYTSRIRKLDPKYMSKEEKEKLDKLNEMRQLFDEQQLGQTG